MAGADVLINNLLCFLSTAVADFSTESLFDLACYFYSHKNIKQSKSTLGNLLHKDITWRCDPEMKKKDLRDVLDLLKDLRESKIKAKFVANSYKGMPPVDLEFVGPLISNLSDEITKLNEVLSNISDIKCEVRNTTDIVRELKKNINDINKTIASAFAGIEEATKDITQDDIHVLNDLRSFRNSIGKGRPSLDAVDLERNIRSFRESIIETPTREHDSDIGNQMENIIDSVGVSDPSTVAISKKKEVRNENKKKKDSVEASRFKNQQVTSTWSPVSERNVIEHQADGREGWTLVRRKKHQSPCSIGNTVKERNITSYRLLGSKRDVPFAMRPVRRMADIFLGRANKDVEVDAIKECIKDNFNVIVQNIENVKIFSNDFNAFKITTFLDERDKLFNADLWPEGMIVNKFYKRKS